MACYYIKTFLEDEFNKKNHCLYLWMLPNLKEIYMAFESAEWFPFATALQFYWQSSLLASGRDSQSLLFGYKPYHPQCDAFGQWLPSQCHLSTGKTSL